MKKRKPVLLIDQDDVLAAYIKGVIQVFNERYQKNFKIDDCVDWNLVSIFGEQILEVMHEPELFRHLEPIEGAIETVERLYRSDLFEMYIVTAAHPSSVEAKHEWLKEHMPFFPQNHVIVCSVKNMIKGDYLLDDGLHNIIAFKEAGGRPIIFDKPHNRDTSMECPRISSWREFEELIMNECYPELQGYYFETKEKVI